MIYWIVYALFSVIESFTDIFFYWYFLLPCLCYFTLSFYYFCLHLCFSYVFLFLRLLVFVLIVRVPFYCTIKILFVLWLSMPFTRGSLVLYNYVVAPQFAYYEPVRFIIIITFAMCHIDLIELYCRLALN